MAQIHALTPEGRLPSAATAHVKELRFIDEAFMPVGTDWNDLPPDRAHKITERLSDAAAAAQNAPGRGRWNVFTMSNVGNLRVQIAWLNTRIAGAASMMYRGRDSTGWGPWQSLMGASEASVQAVAGRVSALEAATPPGAAPSSGFKAVGVPITAGHSGFDAPPSGTYRLPLDWVPAAVPVSRAKVRIRNINIRNSATRAGQISLDGIWVGVPDSSGHFSTAPQQVSGPVTFDGAQGYETPWFDVAGQTLTDKAVSYAYTATEAPWAMLATGYRHDEQRGPNTGNPGFAPTSSAAFAVDLIVETYSTTPVFALLGDSSSVGVGAQLFREGWGTRLAQHLGAIPQILGSSGDTAQATTDPTAFKLNRFPDCTPADALLFALGTNDAAGSRTLEQIEGYMDSAINGARHLGRRIYGVSAKPRNSDTPGDGFEERRRTISGWFAEQRWGLHGYIDYVPAVSSDDEAIDPEYDADGTHVNAAGYQAIADRIDTHYKVTAPAPLYA